jgi:hypothetical protein
MWRIPGFVVTLLPVWALAQAPTPPAQDSLLDRFAGRWVASGNVGRKATTHDIEAAWVLAHRYLRVHEVSREKSADGAPQYEAYIYIARTGAANGEYSCLWLDSTSGEGLVNGISCRAQRNGDSIPFVFRDPQGHVDFHTTFAYDRATDIWTWKLDNVKDDKPVPFARFKLEKKLD